MLSPTLVGREDQLAAVRAHLAAARDGRGGVVWITGEAGVGKSRLIREVLADLDPPTVLHGRAVDALNQAPFRPLTEAFQSAFRGVDRPDSVLQGLAAHAGALVPAWVDAELASDVASHVASPVVVGEAAIRLLQVSADDGWCVLVLEDLHWADPETLEVVQLIAGATLGEPVLTLCTARPDVDATERIERLSRDRPGSTVELGPLDERSIRAMVAACLDVEDPPPGLDEFLAGHTDGNPYLVEELLAGLVSSGDLRRIDGLWTVGGAATDRSDEPPGVDPWPPRIPRTRDAPGPRGCSPARARLRLGAAAGHRRDRRPNGGRRAARCCRRRPRRDAGTSVPVPTRADPGGRARRTAPAGPAAVGGACLAGDRARASGSAGSGTRARRRSRGGRRRPRRRGRAARPERPPGAASRALATAESTARRAVRIAGGPAAAIEAERTLVDVLVTAGKVADALAIGRELSERIIAVADDTTVVEHHLTLARAAVLAGNLAVAAEEVDAARGRAGGAPDASVAARLDVVAAHVALDNGDLATAGQLAEQARTAASHQPDVACDATLVLGRVVRAREWSGAITLFDEAAAIAERAGLASWHLRARQELASSTWVTGDVSRLVDLRSTAVGYGAITTVAQIDLALADIALSTFDAAGCRRAASDCLAAARRYSLAAEPVAHLWLAGAAALAGDEEAMRASIDDALASDPDDPRILGDLFGRVLLTRAFVQDELHAVPELLEQMADHVRRASPGTSVYPGRAPRALLHAITGDDRATQSRSDLALLAGTGGMPFFDLALDLVDAVAAGRTGAASEAEARFGPAYAALAGSTLGAGPVHSLALFFAPAAHRDGWGDPVAWLRAAEAWFDARDFLRISRRCRVLLGEVGAPVPRRGRGTTPVPEGLRAMGVTSREVEVLRLVVAGSTNRQIAEELVLSPKTVERHLSNLFNRTGATSRTELVDVTADHLGVADR